MAAQGQRLNIGPVCLICDLTEAMSEKRRARRKQLDTSHQRNWLTGRHAVSEVLKAGVWPVVRLCVTPAARDMLTEALPLGWKNVDAIAELKPVTSERLTELCGSRHHQGMAAQMGPFPYRSLEDLDRLLQSVSDCEVPPVILICDRIQDAHNLGAILRSCDAMAVTAVIIGEREQVGVTAQVARSSAGAVNYVPIIRVESLDDAASAVKRAGLKLLAASEKSSTPVWNMDASVGIALIIGSESHGVADTLLAKSDGAVSIPMAGKVSSLNAAVAAGMLLYELRRDGD